MKKITIVIISLLCIGCSATKQQTQCFHDLNYDNYRSNIDTTFNYAEDIKEFFITEDK